MAATYEGDPHQRQWYETPGDLGREQGVAAQLARCLGVDLHKLAAKVYGIDYMLSLQGRCAGWCEVKVRRNPSSAYQTYMLSLHKYRNAISMAHLTRRPFLLAVMFTDGLQVLPLTDPTGRSRGAADVRLGGRKDRYDAQDIEPVVHVPMTWALLPTEVRGLYFQ